jgi:hypothetical protein|uniref:Chorismate-binding protein n=1 Tax=Ignisphaera aggregans TaxID=334771 RepID=A0A7J2U188_9CREN
MPCKTQVKVKDPISHIEITLAPEKVYIIKNNKGKIVKIGLFKSPKTGHSFRALLPLTYEC